MTTVLEKPQTILLDQLRLQPQIAADLFRPYAQRIDRGQYVRFLEMMYYYTLHSEAILTYGGEHSPNAELREFFLEMAREERGHYRLALADLEALGVEFRPSDEIPQEIQVFHDFWHSLSADGGYGFLGALYTCENVGKYLVKEATSLLQNLALEKTQCRWISVHLEADIEHGNEVEEHILNYFDSEGEVIVDAAAKMAPIWAAILSAPLKG